MGFVQEAVDAGAQVVGVNCCAPKEAVAFLDAIQDIDAIRDGRMLLSAMPNVGSFQRISHRYMTQVNPEYMGKLGRGLSDRGVPLIGGCCGVHPSHIAEMANYLGAEEARSRAAAAVSDRQDHPTLLSSP